MIRVWIILCLITLTVIMQVGAADDQTLVISGQEVALRDNILITIDDCINETNVRTMFDLLNERGLHATFFPNTRNMLKHDPQLWRDIVAAGNEIGYHTRSHRSGLTPEALTEDFGLFQDEVRQILGDPNYAIRYVRPPEGLWNADWLSWAMVNGLYTVKWNVVPPVELDYLQDVLVREQGGGILLLHPVESNVTWLQTNIDALLQMHDANGSVYKITTVSTAFND